MVAYRMIKHIQCHPHPLLPMRLFAGLDEQWRIRGAISHCAKECSEELSRQWTNTEGKALAAALLCRSGVFDIRWRPQHAQRLKYRIQCDRLRAGRGHAFFIG